MKKVDKRISEYIDILNSEKSAGKFESFSLHEEEMMKAARLLKGANKPIMPGPGYERRLAAEINRHLPQKRSAARRSRLLSFGAVGLAAVIIAVVMLNVLPMTGMSIVNAMEKAFDGIKAYHGILLVQEINALGEKETQARLEVWSDKDGHYYVRELEGREKGLITVNNGVKKWQIQPDRKLVQIFSAFPDPYRFTFELGNEIDSAKTALSIKEAGQEAVDGRPARVLEVTPKGGTTYRIWIDKETNLPLQKQSAMQNALQYMMTYTEIDFGSSIPKDLVAYSLPDGYQEIDANPVQIMASSDEIEAAAGFSPILPQNIPDGYVQDGMALRMSDKTVQLNYVSINKKERVVVLEGKPSGNFTPAPSAVLGSIGQSVAEIQSPVSEDQGVLGGGGLYAGITDISSIRWRSGDLEYAVVGNAAFDDLVQFIKGITDDKVSVPTPDTQTADKPKVEVPVDMETETNEQKSVDAGHSPWRLDPLFVTQVFVSLKISPEGITGDYPIHKNDMKMISNDGVNAVVEVSGNVTPISRVYLKRLVRQDSTGIWTVVGYDPVE